MAVFFITGGTGFVGNALIRSLLTGDNKMICLTRRKKKHLMENKSILWFEADLFDADAYKHLLTHADYVFHLAGLIHARKKEDYVRTNVEGTEVLLNACRETKAPVKRFLYMSSIAAMGANYDGALLKETDACSPRTEYGKSKLLAEQAVMKFSRTMPAVILRPSYIYGRGDMRGLTFLKSICDRPASPLTPFIKTISLCHISDVVGGCLCAARGEIESGEIFIISDPGVYSRERVKAIVREVIDEKKEIAPFFESIPETGGFAKRITRHQHWGCDVTKAKKMLGFQPGMSLTEGVRDTVTWYITRGLFTPGKHK